MDTAQERMFESVIALRCLCEPRYVWREVNYCMFLYDRLEDVYIPEQVYWELKSGRAI